MPSRLFLACAALLAITLGLAGCPDHRAVRVVPPDDAGLDAGEEDGGDDAGIDAGPDGGFDGGPDGGRPGCQPGIQYIFTFSNDRTLRRFDPATLRFETVGTLACQSSSPFSMAVDRSGQAWVEYADGALYHVDTRTAGCSRTGFVPFQAGFNLFGMGFAASDPMSAEDSLFISDVGGQGLATIDTRTFAMTWVGFFQGLTGNGITNRGELTGTGDGKLYGGFEGSPFQLAEVDATSAKIISQDSLAPLDTFSMSGGNFALAAYGTDFWLFSGPGGSTDVYRFRPSTKEMRLMLHVNFAIVGAGVSTCASQ